MYNRTKDKEEKNNDRRNVDISTSNLKNRRVLSQKPLNQKKGMTNCSGNDRYFNEFFEQFPGNSKNGEK